MCLQTVQYTRHGKLIELSTEVRIWVKGNVCVVGVSNDGTFKWQMCRAETTPNEQCGTFVIFGVEDGDALGLQNAIARAKAI
jgi:hypothetical protein